jgi:hypothetical protein
MVTIPVVQRRRVQIDRNIVMLVAHHHQVDDHHPWPNQRISDNDASTQESTMDDPLSHLVLPSTIISPHLPTKEIIIHAEKEKEGMKDERTIRLSFLITSGMETNTEIDIFASNSLETWRKIHFSQPLHQ